MKKKGFTLIELLAVIVILAVIALIATPAVLNIIEDSKKAAAEASARNIVSAAKSYYMQNLMDNISIGTIDLSKKTLAYDGEQATKGSISYDKNGNAYGKMYVSGYCVEIKSDGTVSSDKVKESECSIENDSTTTDNPVASDAFNGIAVNKVISGNSNIGAYVARPDAYLNKTVGEVVKNRNKENSTMNLQDMLTNLSVDTTENIKNTSGEVINLNNYEIFTSFYDIAILENNTLSFEKSSKIELIIESDSIKNLTKEDLIVIQVDSKTGKVYFVSLSDYDEKNGYATVTLPILGPTMFAIKV